MKTFLVYFVCLLACDVLAQEEGEQPPKDTIWYPSEESDDLFVSNYGEKWRYLIPEWNTIKKARQRRDDEDVSREGGLGFFRFNRQSKFRPQQPGFDSQGPRQPFQFDPQGQRQPFQFDPQGQRPPFQFDPQRPRQPFPFNPKPLFDTQFTSPPTTSGLVFPGGSERPTRTTSRSTATPPTRRTTTSSPPTDSTTLSTTTTTSTCERQCIATQEFNPVCGSDDVNYSNPSRLKCAQKCGKDVEYVHHGNCGARSTSPSR